MSFVLLVPGEHLHSVRRQLADCDVRMTEIGRVEREPGLRITGGTLSGSVLPTSGYRHF